jgi:purine-binding chemotaxis protein CheW
MEHTPSGADAPAEPKLDAARLKRMIDESARKRELGQELEEQRDLLRILLNQESYGIRIEDVVEVRECPRIFRIPHTPGHILGVINLKGEILSIVDIRKLLGLPTASQEGQKYIVVVERDDLRVGIIVDRVSNVIKIPDSSIKPSLSTAKAAASGARRLIAGEVQLDGEVLAVLNLDALRE